MVGFGLSIVCCWHIGNVNCVIRQGSLFRWRVLSSCDEKPGLVMLQILYFYIPNICLSI